ncbi:MAG: FecR domain-containing protein [Leeuwenhoekiella sp.]
MTAELIVKYLNGEASEKEVAQVFTWINTSEENKSTFITLKQAYALQADNNSGKIASKTLIDKRRKKKKQSFKLLKRAAVLVLLVGVGSLFFLFPDAQKSPEGIVLETSDGQTQLLNENQERQLINASGTVVGTQRQNALIYEAGKAAAAATVQTNTLKVPYGKTFKLVLSDSTVIHLNAGSAITYPERFISSEPRKVSLQGEAFFEVTKNKSWPFVVTCNDVDVEVLGTAFNLSAYAEDNSVRCALVEGSVKLKRPEGHTLLLEPGELGVYDKQARNLSSTTANVTEYAAWVHGQLIFNKTPFTEIEKRLERSFAVAIDNKNSGLSSQAFTGSISVGKSNIEDLFALFRADTPFDYVIDGKKIVIDGGENNTSLFD